MVRYLLAAAIAAATLSPAAAQSPDATLDRAVGAYAKVKTVRATFAQTLTNPLTGSTVNSRGEMLQRRPNQLAVTFTEPAGDRIVADGTWLWLYLPSSTPGQVIRTRIGQGGAGVPDLTAQFLDSPRSRYSIADAGRATVAGRAAHALALTARDASVPFAKATIWVDDADGLVRQFEVTDANGVVRRVTTTKLAINAPVDRAAFRFAPPKGVRVVEQPGQR